MVATVAYGMGINKRDVRVMVLYGAPRSTEDFVQQIGRAGRDGYQSSCYMFYREEELTSQSMKSLVHLGGCRREHIVNYFGQAVSFQIPCSQCDNCRWPSPTDNLWRDALPVASFYYDIFLLMELSAVPSGVKSMACLMPVIAQYHNALCCAHSH